MSASDSLFVKEIIIPVPWGVIAAKTWGDPCSSPVLVLHGIQDNAGSFDNLLTILPRSYYYVCIDLPGHGLSTRMPKGFRLDFIDYVLSVDRVVRHLKWNNFIIMGHSLGGQISMFYSGMFPEKVSKMIILDALGPFTVKNKTFLEYIKGTHENIMLMEEKLLDNNPPSYTKEDALQKAIKNRRSHITKEAAEKLLPRNLKQGKDGYYFSLDQRLKYTVTSPITRQQLEYVYKQVKCPFVIIITEITNKLASAGYEHSYFHIFKALPNGKIVVVPGDHDVHNISPEVVAPHVIEILTKQISKL